MATKKKKALTNNDLFAGWKNQRFTIAPNYTFSDVDDNCKHLIVLTDLRFWTLASDDLDRWCEENNCKTKGMTVEIPSDRELTLFCLRWA
jgi:hypothetical protein